MKDRSVRANPLAGLFPELGPWTLAALTSGFEQETTEPPRGRLTNELDVILSEKLGPFLLELLRRSPSVVDDQTLARVRIDAAARVARTRHVTRAGDSVRSELVAEGVTPLIIKGPGTAHWYADPGLRTWTDLDLIVPSDAFGDALRLLGAHGWREQNKSLQPRQIFNRHCRESVNLVLGEYLSVDLHHRPSPWAWTRSMTCRRLSLRADGDTIWAGGADNMALSALQLIGDHVSPGRKLIAWRDLAELGRSLPVDRTATVLEEVGLAGTVGALLRGLPAAMQPTCLIEALPTRPEHPRRLRAMLSASAGGHQVLSHVTRLPPPNALLYAVGMLAPSKRFLDARLPGSRHPRREWLRRVVRGDHAGLQFAEQASATPAVTSRSPAPGDQLYRPASGTTWSLDGEGQAVVHFGGHDHVLDRAATPLWAAIAEGLCAADLAAVITVVDHADVSSARLRAVSFVAQLELQGLVSRAT